MAIRLEKASATFQKGLVSIYPRDVGLSQRQRPDHKDQVEILVQNSIHSSVQESDIVILPIAKLIDGTLVL